jgi:excisionase family DNA binding protein
MSDGAQQWLTVEDLADEINVPLKSIYVWNHKGTGPAFTTFGRHVRYSRKAVDEWIASGATKREPIAKAG